MSTLDFAAIIAAIVLLGHLVVSAVFVIRDTVRKRGKWGINLKEVRCPECGTTMPWYRQPANLRQALWGGGTCPYCGQEVDKWGKPVSTHS